MNWRLYSLLLAFLLALGCATTSQKTRLSSVEPIVVTWRVVGPVGDEEVPAGLKAEVFKNLQARGFEPIEGGASDYALVIDLLAKSPAKVEKKFRWPVVMRAVFSQVGSTPRYIESTYSAVVDRPSESSKLAIEASQARIIKDIDAGAERFIAALEPRVRQQARPVIPGLYRSGDALYFVMIDRFSNGDPSNDAKVDLNDPQAFHGGDIRGLIDHLDHLKELGIKTVWISPTFKMRTDSFFGHGAFHGYWLEDPSKIEPRFGDEALLRELRDELDKRGMRLVMDVVLNHVAPESELVARHPEWFHLNGGITDWNDKNQVQNFDVHGLPDIDQSVPQAYDWVAGSTLAWISQVKPAGFRLDAVKHISNAFWQRFNAEAKAAGGPEFLLLGELLDGNAANVAAVARDGGFNAMFDFPLHFAMVDVFCKDHSPARLAAVLSADRLYGDMLGAHREGLVTLLDNHDLPRILTACNGDLGRVRQALQFMLTARGTPSFTWGTEAGLEGAQEPENRADMNFEADHALGRAIHDGLERRRMRSVFQNGMDVLLEVEDGFLAYLRVSQDDAKPEVILIVVNATMGLRTVKIPAELGTDMTQVEVPAGQTTVTILESDAKRLAAYRAAKSKNTKTQIEVIVDNVELAEGESLMLVGSGPELGNWSPDRQAPTFSKKNGQLALNLSLPSGLVFAYKLVRLKDGKTTWEEHPDRFLFVQNGQTISLSFGL